MSSLVRESDVPRQFNISHDENDMPQRELRDFTVMLDGEKISICALDDGAGRRGAPMVARGTVTSKSKSLRTESAGLVDWCIEYTNGGVDPTLWVRTQHVWYKLLRPSKDYARTHELARRRYELCSRIYILLTTMHPSECQFMTILPLLAQNYREMKSYSEREILMERDFILSQFKMLRDPIINESRFVKELRAAREGESFGSSVGSLGAQREISVRPNGASRTSAGEDSYYDNNATEMLNLTGVDEDQQWESSANWLDADAKARVLKKAEKALASVMKSRNAKVFNQPVDPIAEGCSDYLDRIARPMDYGTIKKRLESRKYYDVKDVVRDVRQVTTNCIQYNSIGHMFSQWALSHQKKFEAAVRAAEDAELGATRKRQTVVDSGANKRRKLSTSDPSAATGGSTGSTGAPKASNGKRGPKVSKKAGRAPKESKSPSSSQISPAAHAEEENSISEVARLCGRAESKACERAAAANSKYCSTECGMIVARERIRELMKKGHNPETYVRTFIAKSMVHNRT